MILRGLARTIEAAEPPIHSNAQPARVTRRFRAFLESHPLTAVDVGARGGLPPEWRDLARHLRLASIEPDAKEAALLKDRLALLLPAALHVVTGAAGPKDACATLHVTREPGRSSLFPPNADVVARYGAPHGYDVLERRSLVTRSLTAMLDEHGIDAVDLLKLDIQGAELDVLRSLDDKRLAGLLLLQTEVEFVELYRGQPLFRDVDAFLAARGFELFHLSRTYANYGGNRWAPYGRGQLQFADAFYLRTDVESLPAERVARLIFLASYYGWNDYGYHLYRREGDRLNAALPPTQAAVFQESFAPFESPRPSLSRMLHTGLNLVLDRILFAYLRLRRWNGLKSDTDRAYPLR